MQPSNHRKQIILFPMARNPLHTIPEMETSLDDGIYSNESEGPSDASDLSYSDYSATDDSLLLDSSEYNYDCLKLFRFPDRVASSLSSYAKNGRREEKEPQMDSLNIKTPKSVLSLSVRVIPRRRIQKKYLVK